MNLLEVQYLPLIQAALREDIRSEDATTNALIPADATATANLNFRENGLACGLEIARSVFLALDEKALIEVLVTEGQSITAGTTAMRIVGKARAVLTGERVALNYSQRLSGIATLTRQFVQAVSGTNAKIADTRKTTPGLRLLEKYAVRCGGGSNHRFALDDMILIKDNHIALCGGVDEAVRRAREYSGHTTKVEVECDTLAQVERALQARADIILLDNMSIDDLTAAVALIDGQAIAEASGGVDLQSVRAIAQCGVDIISVGALTHSARALDIGLDIVLNPR